MAKTKAELAAEKAAADAKTNGLMQEFINQTQSGTQTPGQISNKAFEIGKTAGTKAGKSVLKGAQPVIGLDAEGKPLSLENPLYPAGSEFVLLNKLPPDSRAKLQRDMYSLGLYPENYTPTFGMLSPTEDATAVSKLMIVGEQKGLADVNDVIKLARTDKKVKDFLVSGGYTKTGPKLTDVATASANLNNYFLDMFNDKPSKAEAKEYQSLINNAERASKGSIGAQQAEDILLSVATKKANGLIAAAKLGDPKAQTQLEAGQLGRTVRAIRNAYADNGLPTDDKSIYSKAVKASRSNTAYDNVIQSIRLSAKTVWAPLSDNIDLGFTVKDQLDPFITSRSKITGIPKEQIKISDMTDVIDENGKLKSISKYNSEIYKSDAYLQSDNFKQQKLNDIQAVIRNFGIG
jgi:hypothetical protein